MVASSGPNFLDRFNFHLAEHLLGVKALESFEKFMQAPTCNTTKNSGKSSPLYWRSPLILEEEQSKGIATMTSDTTSNDGTGSKTNLGKILFVDVTFHVEVLHDSNKVHLNAQLGCFLVENPTGVYIKGSPITLSQLEQHAQSLGLDLYSAPPKAMAGMLAKTLASKKNKATAVVSDEGNHLDLSFYYDEIDESGIFSMSVEEKTSRFDTLGVSLMVRMFLQHQQQLQVYDTDIPSSSSFPISNAHSSFDFWFQRISAQAFLQEEHHNLVPQNDNSKLQHQQPTSITQESTKSTTVTTSTATFQPSNLGKSRISRPAPQVYQYTKLPNKRRKKGRLSFAKPT